MNDFLPPKRQRPLENKTQSIDVPQQHVPERPPATTSAESAALGDTDKRPRHSRRKKVSIAAIAFIVVSFIALLATIVFYNASLQPVDSSKSATKQSVTVEPGSTPAQIAALLKQKDLIKNQKAFEIYTRLSGNRSKLQAGSYQLSPSDSTQQIVEHLASGKVDAFKLTFYPGGTLRAKTDGTKEKATSVEAVLLQSGYSQEEIDQAFSSTYDSPLFAGKPDDADLEGYVYGETYSFNGGVSVKEILQRTFDEYYAQIKKYDLVEGYKKQGLSLYQGITLASIIQREVNGYPDQSHVAQVFLTRLKQEISLGSDVTYQYAAKKLGLPPTPDLNSPYNTRRFKGLPPGPIASPGVTALRAVATPTSTNDLFFLSGDDDVTYFSKTDAEHEQNIKDHCAVKCSVF